MTVTTQTDTVGAIGAAGLRRAVWVLSVTEITSWGVLYYAFAVLSSDIVEDTGWTSTAVTAALSMGLVVSGLVGIVLGRRLDRHGPRRIMTSSSALAVVAVVIIATAPTYPAFLAGWVVAGIAMAGTLYAPAFAALTHWGGTRRVAALTTVTLVAGLASTVFAPLTAVLQTATNWRVTYLILATLLAVVTIPLHWWGLNHPWTPGQTRHGTDHTHDRETRTIPFLALMVTATIAAFAVYAAIINLVPLLLERGLTATEAAVVLGVGGIGQVVGRLGYARFDAATTPVSRLTITISAVAITTALAAAAPAGLVILFVVSALMGVARGIFTLVQATAVSDRWGTAKFGHLNGILTAPVLLASALAPFAGAALADGLGGQAEAFVVLAAAAALAVIPALATNTGRTRHT